MKGVNADFSRRIEAAVPRTVLFCWRSTSVHCMLHPGVCPPTRIVLDLGPAPRRPRRRMRAPWTGGEETASWHWSISIRASRTALPSRPFPPSTEAPPWSAAASAIVAWFAITRRRTWERWGPVDGRSVGGPSHGDRTPDRRQVGGWPHDYPARE